MCCNQIITEDGDLFFCADCKKKIEWTGEKCCGTCACSLEQCSCHGNHTAYDKAIAPFYYASPVKELIVHLKQSEQNYKLKMLAEILKLEIDKKYPGITFDMIVTVPDTKASLRKAGFNRMKHLAIFLNRQMGVEYKKDALKKIKETKKQHQLDYVHRLVNLEGAYWADESLVKGKKIMLLDDVLTTGTTLNTCAKELKGKGAALVYCVTITATRLVKSELPAKELSYR